MPSATSAMLSRRKEIYVIMSAEPLLSLKNVKVTFGGVRALKGVSSRSIRVKCIALPAKTAVARAR